MSDLSISYNRRNNKKVSTTQANEDTIGGGRLFPAYYINGTTIAKARGKLIGDYLRLSTTKCLINKKAESLHIPSTDLVYIIQSGLNGYRGTFVHPALEDDLRMWAERRFDRQVGKKIDGNVYCIYSKKAKCCKIGYSTDVYARLKTLQTGFPYKLTIGWVCKGTLQLEKTLHTKFELFALHGEWFDIRVLDMLPAQHRQA